MPKPNRLLIGDAWAAMDPDYLGGARAARAGLAAGRGSPSWRAGERNEAALEHVRFGLDLLAAPAAERSFEEDPGLPRLSLPGRPLHRDTALLAHMEATGSLHEAAIACRDSAWIPDSWRHADPSVVARIRAEGASYQLMRPARLRAVLAARGVPVSPDMSKALLRRLEHEHQTRFQPLTFLEETRLSDAPGEVRLLVDVLGRRQGREWLACPWEGEVEADARRPRGWARAIASRMQDSGLGALVRCAGEGGIRLTGKGCAAALAFAEARRAPTFGHAFA